jgi:DNA-binding transcriptional regulator YdaS (Cro superfamily)
MADVHVATLRRAAQIVGGEQELALQLGVTPSHLALWLAGYDVPPGDVFLRAVDVVVAHQIVVPKDDSAQ